LPIASIAPVAAVAGLIIPNIPLAISFRGPGSRPAIKLKAAKLSPSPFTDFSVFVAVHRILSSSGGFPKTSVLGKATLDLWKKRALDRFFGRLSQN
jgi:hypothetical protein